MFRHPKKSLLSVTAFTLAALAAAILALTVTAVAPPARAAECEGGGSGSFYRFWEDTPEAIARTAAGECPNGGTCKEWCASLCGETEPLGVFACFY